MRNASLAILFLVALAATACSERHRATVVLMAEPPLAGTAAGRHPTTSEVQAALTAFSTVRAAAVRHHFQLWEQYRGKTAEEVARLLLPDLETRTPPGTTLVKLSVEHEDQRLAPRIVNAIAEVYLSEFDDPSYETAVEPPVREARDRAEALRAEADALLRAEGLGPATLPIQFEAAGESYRMLRARIEAEELALIQEAPLIEGLDKAIKAGELDAFVDDGRIEAVPEILATVTDLGAARRRLAGHQELLGPHNAKVIAAMDEVGRLEERARIQKRAWVKNVKRGHQDRTEFLRQLEARLGEVEAELNRLAALEAAAASLDEAADRVMKDATSRTAEILMRRNSIRPVRAIEWATVPADR